MHKNLADTTEGSKWLSHFNGYDRLTAEKLLNGIIWISDVEFKSTLKKAIKQQSDKYEGPVGLLIERELRHNRYGVQSFYKQSQPPRRAYGAAIQPIESKRYDNYQIGSEGTIATLATEITKEDPAKFLLHPTVKQLRTKKISAFFVLTDTIGSGGQVSTFLDSLWKVATLKSYHSFKKLEFVVIGYATTPEGRETVRSHPCSPEVTCSIGCPTIDSVFNEEESKEIKDLCSRYSRKQTNKRYGPLGFDNCGTLIAYAHGIPNNAPLLLHKMSKKKIPPLFKSRVTGDTKNEMNTGLLTIDHVSTLHRIEQLKLATSDWLKTADKDAKDFIVTLAALNRKPRSINAISKRTSLKYEDVEKNLKLARECEWVSEKTRLTDEGISLLNQLKKKKNRTKKLEWKINMLYHPESLRMQ